MPSARRWAARKGGMFRSVRAENLSAEVINALLAPEPRGEPRRGGRRDLGLRPADAGAGLQRRPLRPADDADSQGGQRADHQPALRLLHDGPPQRGDGDHVGLRRPLRRRRRGAHGPRPDDPRGRLQPGELEAQREGRRGHGADRRVPRAAPQDPARGAGPVRLPLADAGEGGDATPGRSRGRSSR